jgi:hypothetical protein
MFLKANKVTWRCCLPPADEKLGGHFPKFSTRKSNIPDFRPSTPRNISFVTIELVLIGCPAEPCAPWQGPKPALYVLSTFVTKSNSQEIDHRTHKDNQRKADIQCRYFPVPLTNDTNHGIFSLLTQQQHNHHSP